MSELLPLGRLVAGLPGVGPGVGCVAAVTSWHLVISTPSGDEIGTIARDAYLAVDLDQVAVHEGGRSRSLWSSLRGASSSGGTATVTMTLRLRGGGAVVFDVTDLPDRGAAAADAVRAMQRGPAGPPG